MAKCLIALPRCIGIVDADFSGPRLLDGGTLSQLERNRAICQLHDFISNSTDMISTSNAPGYLFIKLCPGAHPKQRCECSGRRRLPALVQHVMACLVVSTE
jgi:hypothetical protein